MPAEEKKRGVADDELERLLSPAGSIDLRIKQNFLEMQDGIAVLLIEKQDEQALINARLVSFFESEGIGGIYISLNKPLAALVGFLKKQGVEGSNVFFIDAITRMTSDSESSMKAQNYLYVDSPKNLIDISVAMEGCVKKIKSEKKFILLDSVNTLLVYNKPTITEKFVHSISGKARSWNAKAVFSMIKGSHEEITKTISQFCDITTEL